MFNAIGQWLNGTFSPPAIIPDWKSLKLYDAVDAKKDSSDRWHICLRWYWNNSDIKASWKNLWIGREPAAAIDVWYVEEESCNFAVEETGERVDREMNQHLSIARLWAACAVRYEDGSVGIPLMPVRD